MLDSENRNYQFLQVRRVIASIAYANGEFDEAERQLLASAVTETYHFSDDEKNKLLEDAASLPAIENLMALISAPEFLRLFFAELMTLALTKESWDEREIEAVTRALNSAKWPTPAIEKIKEAFDLLRSATSPNIT